MAPAIGRLPRPALCHAAVAARFRASGGLVLIGKAAVLKTAAVKAAYRFESCALRSPPAQAGKHTGGAPANPGAPPPCTCAA